jgi:DNA-binding response OmpR family regulator
MRILICEDEFLMQKTIEQRLQRDGFEVIIAKDGREALSIIDTQPVDLIVTDLLMPFVSGLELIEYVKREKRMNIPILVLSKVGLEATVERAFEIGADDYITKPFSPNELAIRVKRFSKRF